MVTCLYMIAVAKFTMHIQYRFTCTFLLLCLGKTAFNGTARWLTDVLVQVISLNLPLVLVFCTILMRPKNLSKNFRLPVCS